MFGRILMRDVSSPTNQRTLIATFAPSWPAGHKTPVLGLPGAALEDSLVLLAQLNSLTLDYFLRLRFAISGGGGSLILAMLSELALWKRNALPVEARRWMAQAALRLTGLESVLSSAHQDLYPPEQPRQPSALTPHERLRLRCMLDALNAIAAGITSEGFRWILRDCDYPVGQSTDRKFTRELFGKGFWRIDKDRDPELRHTVLTLIAFHDLEAKIREHGGSRDAGVASFLAQNQGEGWALPETLRLAEYGLGHDERSQRPQAVAVALGPRFFDWQLMGHPSNGSAELTTHASHVAARQGLRPQQIASVSEGTAATQHSVAQQELFAPLSGDAGGRLR